MFVCCNGGLFKSLNGGAGWERVDKDYNLCPASVSAARAGRDLVIATTGWNVWLSLDGGISWQCVVDEAFVGARTNSVAIDPRNPEVVWACTDKGVCRSTSSGNQWLLRNEGLPENYEARFVRFDLSDPSRVYLCGSSGGIYRCQTFAGAWEPVVSEELESISIYDLAVHPEDPDTLYACTRDFGVVKSVDGGINWAPKNAGLSELRVDRLVVSSVAPDVLYCASNERLYVSEDGAESWQRRDEGLDVGYHARRLIASPVSADVTYVGAQFGVYRTVDRGLSWSAANLGIACSTVVDMAFHPSHPGAIFVSSDTGFFRTTDNRHSWDLMSMEGDAQKCAGVQAVALDPQEPGRGLHLGACDVGNGEGTKVGISNLASAEWTFEP
ncbi:hypothetical protein J7M28_11240 [bacterium]|nr:hypothetical protein [bacterium]